MLRLRPSVISIVQDDMDDFNQRYVRVGLEMETKDGNSRKPPYASSMSEVRPSIEPTEIANIRSGPGRKVSAAAQALLARVQSQHGLSLCSEDSCVQDDSLAQRGLLVKPVYDRKASAHRAARSKSLICSKGSLRPSALRRSATTTAVQSILDWRIMNSPPSFPATSTYSKAQKSTGPPDIELSINDDRVSSTDALDRDSPTINLATASSSRNGDSFNDVREPLLWISPLDMLIQRLCTTPVALSTTASPSTTGTNFSTPLLDGSLFYGPTESPSRRLVHSPSATSLRSATPAPVPHAPHYHRSPSPIFQEYVPGSVTGNGVDGPVPPSYSYDNGRVSNISASRHPTEPNTKSPGRRPHNAVTKTPRTPRVRVYDDELPAFCQPQTPADLGYPRVGLSSTRNVPLVDSRDLQSRPLFHPAFIPHGESRYPTPTHLHAPTSAERQVDDSDEQAQLQPRHRSGRPYGTPRVRDQENVFDPHAMGMARGIGLLMSNRDNGSPNESTMESTPPRQGRFEHLFR